jgi:beta-mannosidase
MARHCAFLLLLPLAVAQATTTAPTNPAELKTRLAELRRHYEPYLRSLPLPTPAPFRQRLSGTGWLRCYEFKGLQPPADHTVPNWSSPTLDTSGWEPCEIPEWNYSGEGRAQPHSAILWYRHTFHAAPTPKGQRQWLVFDGVDWLAEVWLNGQKLGCHRCYHEPFRFDVTALTQRTNVLAIRVTSGMAFGEPAAYWSVFPMPQTRDHTPGRYTRDRGVSTRNQLNGDPHLGDGHGVHRDVWLETTGPIRLGQIFVRAADDRHSAKVRLEIDSAEAASASIHIQVLAENFDNPKRFGVALTRTLSTGTNVIEAILPTPGLMAWTPDTPRLYRCTVTIQPSRSQDVPAVGSAQRLDSPHERQTHASTFVQREIRSTLFGARSFHLVTAADQPRLSGFQEGTLLLNDQPFFLRGANIQGLNLLWLWSERQHLLEVLLYLKAANFTGVRSCQHVCFPEVLDLLDRLGVLSQQDQGCRGLLSPEVGPQLTESARALARETYNHPGVVLLSFANECSFDPTPQVSAALAVDPDRVLNPICGERSGGDVWPAAGRGDYPQLPSALWDNVITSLHPYLGWYGKVGTLWDLAQHYAPDRMILIGEYGGEALDDYATMRDHYPGSFGETPAVDADALWGNVQVTRRDRRQLIGFRGRAPSNLGEYIRASQNFQADQLTELTRSWRLAPRRVTGYFQFHFVDMLPANWPKAILSHDLTPKRGFFAMAQLNQPVVPLCEIGPDGHSAFLWVANDLPQSLPKHRLQWRFSAGGKVLAGEAAVDVPASDACIAATVPLDAFPDDTDSLAVDLELLSRKGSVGYHHDFFLRAWRLKENVFPPDLRTPNNIRPSATK